MPRVSAVVFAVAFCFFGLLSLSHLTSHTSHVDSDAHRHGSMMRPLWPRQKTNDKSNGVQLFVGIFSVANKTDLRALLRAKYNRVLSSTLIQLNDLVVVKHVIGKTHGNHSQALLDEQARHEDLLLLDTPENMEDGKTFFYFRHLGLLPHIQAQLPTHDDADATFDFVMKLDDDSWLNLPALLQDLRQYRGLPGVYYGTPVNSLAMNFEPRPIEWMSGMGYLLSLDVVRWLASEEALYAWPTRNKVYGAEEDKMLGGWLCDKHKVANIVTVSRARMADYWHGLPFKRATSEVAQSVVLAFLKEDLDQRMVLVHLMKTREMMSAVADWFWEHASAS